MLKFMTTGAFVTALAISASTAAQGTTSTNWWLVIDEDTAQTARFVDIASISRSQERASFRALTLNRNGQRTIETLSVDCKRMLGALDDPEIEAFVCGTEEYRASSGLMLGPVSPDEMANMVFAMQPLPGGFTSPGEA